MDFDFCRVHAPSESWGFPKFCQRSEVVEQTKVIIVSESSINAIYVLSKELSLLKLRHNIDIIFNALSLAV